MILVVLVMRVPAVLLGMTDLVLGVDGRHCSTCTCLMISMIDENENSVARVLLFPCTSGIRSLPNLVQAFRTYEVERC